MPPFQLLSYCNTEVAKSPHPQLCVHVEAVLRVPEFMEMAFIALARGREVIRFATDSIASADSILKNGYEGVNNGNPVLSHPRFQSARVTKGGTAEWDRTGLVKP